MKPTAVVGRRVLAFVIDNIVTYAINAVLFFALADTSDEIARKVISGEISPNATTYVNVTLGDSQYSIVGGKAAIYFLAIFLVWLLYWVVWQGRTGSTVGKAVTGIRLVRESDGTPPGAFKAFVRQIMWIVDAFPYFIPYLTGFILAATTQRNKRVGDMVAGTLVVKKEFAGATEEPRSGRFEMGGLESSSAYGGGLPGEPVSAPAPAPAAVAASAPAAAAPSSSSPPPDWYPDPKGESRLRYWDGSTWTDHTAE